MAENENMIRAKRLLTGQNQQKFWTTLGVTQSGGSRYESGRDMPEPTKMLMDLVYEKSHKKAVERLIRLRKKAEQQIPKDISDAEDDTDL